MRLRYALPATFAGLRIAAPAALLGAIIGEYLGGDTGLGIAMINSEQALEVNRTWGIALFVTLVALIGYVITELVARWLTPWAPRSATAVRTEPSPMTAASVRRSPAGGGSGLLPPDSALRALRSLGLLVISFAVGHRALVGLPQFAQRQLVRRQESGRCPALPVRRSGRPARS